MKQLNTFAETIHVQLLGRLLLTEILDMTSNTKMIVDLLRTHVHFTVFVSFINPVRHGIKNFAVNKNQIFQGRKTCSATIEFGNVE